MSTLLSGVEAWNSVQMSQSADPNAPMPFGNGTTVDNVATHLDYIVLKAGQSVLETNQDQQVQQNELYNVEPDLNDRFELNGFPRIRTILP